MAGIFLLSDSHVHGAAIHEESVAYWNIPIAFHDEPHFLLR